MPVSCCIVDDVELVEKPATTKHLAATFAWVSHPEAWSHAHHPNGLVPKEGQGQPSQHCSESASARWMGLVEGRQQMIESTIARDPKVRPSDGTPFGMCSWPWQRNRSPDPPSYWAARRNEAKHWRLLDSNATHDGQLYEEHVNDHLAKGKSQHHEALPPETKLAKLGSSDKVEPDCASNEPTSCPRKTSVISSTYCVVHDQNKDFHQVPWRLVWPQGPSDGESPC